MAYTTTTTAVAPQVRDCPHCGARASYVIESRTTSLGRRRRYECQSCGSRDSTHEIDQAVLEQLKQDSMHLQRIRALLVPDAELNPLTKPKQRHRCGGCAMANGTDCSLTLPEAFTPDAADCIHYQPTR